MLARTAIALCAVLAAPAVMAQNYFNIQGDGVEFHVTQKGGRKVQTDDSLIGFSSVDFNAQPFVFSVRKGGKFYSSCTATGVQTSSSTFYFTPGGNGAGDFPVRLDKCGPHNGVTLTCFPKVGCPK